MGYAQGLAVIVSLVVIYLAAVTVIDILLVSFRIEEERVTSTDYRVGSGASPNTDIQLFNGTSRPGT